MKSIQDATLNAGQRVLIRGDLDVPLSPTNEIEDTFRLDLVLPTIKYVLDKKCIPVICGHIGRPDGKVMSNLSTTLLKRYFDFNLGEGNYKLLENLRFNNGEESNDPAFAKLLASEADIYVNDCFSASHREHASITGVPKLLPAYAGINLANEVATLKKILQNPEKPFITVIGGAKLETKKPVIAKFLEIADKVLIGGKIGLDWKEEVPANLILPLDYAKDNKDLGPKTLKLYEELILSAKTIVWAGPIGLFEDKEFEEGTRRVGIAIANSKAFSVVGGGDTISALHKFDFFEKINFISSGGGAMLEFISKGSLPGLIALEYNG